MKTAPATSSPAAVPETVQESIPDWVKMTPDETTYQLVMYDDSGGGIQSVDLIRAEFVALKAHLATMRGYAIEGTEETV